MNPLGQLRASLGVSQSELARRLRRPQIEVNKLELTPLGELKLAAVEEYVRALGGRLDLVVVVDGLSHWISDSEGNGEWLR